MQRNHGVLLALKEIESFLDFVRPRDNSARELLGHDIAEGEEIRGFINTDFIDRRKELSEHLRALGTITDDLDSFSQRRFFALIFLLGLSFLFLLLIIIWILFSDVEEVQSKWAFLAVAVAGDTGALYLFWNLIEKLRQDERENIRENLTRRVLRSAGIMILNLNDPNDVCSILESTATLVRSIQNN